MNNHWHEAIQRHLDGQAGAEESAALHQALKEDAGLRAHYLDHLNLDASLDAMANAAAAENRIGSLAPDGRPVSRPALRHWRWFAATAACAALALLVVFSRHRAAARAQPDIAAVTSATHTAISRLRADVPPVLPAWMSPTASLLEPPGFPN